MSTYEISKSSLLSLKAEILRKQELISKAKLENEAKIKILKKVPLEIKNKGVEERSKKDYEEDTDLLKLSKAALEYKSEIYEKLSSGTLSEEKREKYQQVLVRFNEKETRQISDLPLSDSEFDKRRSESENSDYYESDENETKDPSEKWVEYVDCFGRTRKCMQKDLEFLKSKDDELKKLNNDKNDSNEHEIQKDDVGPTDIPDDKEVSKDRDQTETELMSLDMRRELQRKQWEKEEDEIRNKSDIHYEDVLFGEARTHGVGYYGFSKNEEERAKQQEALRNLRKETEDKQKKAQQLKETREKLLAARLKAARNRKRARMGLPPEEDVSEPEKSNPQPDKLEEEELRKQKDQEKEKLLEEARKNYVRPWDVGKEGVKEIEVMTQKEWVEKKREDRPAEFAPPTAYRKNFRATLEDVEVNETLKFSTKSSSINRRHKNIPKHSVASSSGDFPQRKNNSTEKLHTDDNECSSSNEPGRKRAEIEPPLTYDYYGPKTSKIKRNSRTGTDVQDSIEAGLKFLRKQVEDKQKSSRVDDMFLF